MGNWDISTPPGSEVRGRGASRIREMKEALQEALRGGLTDGVEGVFPGAAPLTAPLFRYRGRTGTAAARPAAASGGLYFNATRNSLQRSNGTSWEDLVTMIPAGSVKAWFQATAPAGWTKKTDQTGKALRVVSGEGGGAGGSADPASTIQLAHVHTTVAHSHGGISTDGSHAHVFVAGGAASYGATSNPMLPQVYSIDRPEVQVAGSHNHGGSTGASAPGTNANLVNVSLAHINIILAEKD